MIYDTRPISSQAPAFGFPPAAYGDTNSTPNTSLERTPRVGGGNLNLTIQDESSGGGGGISKLYFRDGRFIGDTDPGNPTDMSTLIEKTVTHYTS